MNLTMLDIVRVHGERIADACTRAHEKLSQMDRSHPIEDAAGILMRLHGDAHVAIPVDLDAPIPNNGLGNREPEEVGALLDVVADRLAEIEGDLDSVRNGQRHVDNEWTAQAAWRIERLQRGETNPVTIGVNPVSRRLLALYQSERVRQGTEDGIMQIVPRANWAEALPGIHDELALVQDLVSAVVPHLESRRTSSVSSTMHHEISLREVIVGHPSSMRIEFIAGQVCCVATILTRLGSGGGNWDSAFLDDSGVVIEQTIPESMVQSLVGKPVETVFDHFLTRGLGLMIESVESDKDNSTIHFARQEPERVVMKDAPASWWTVD